MMITARTVPALLLAGMFVTPVDAQLSEYRTQVQVTNGSGNDTQFAFDGGLNETFASQILTTGADNAVAEASSSLSASGFTPTLRARAVANPTRAQAVAWAVQGYTNTSAAPLTTTLLLSLTADVTGANDLEARVYLFQDEDFEYALDPGTILFETSSQLWPGFEPLANNAGPDGFDVLFGNISGAVDESRSFEFTVDPGDSFYVWARLVATADNPGEVDASGTLTASFTNTAGLQPAAADGGSAPEVACQVGTDLLWPPDHRFVDVGLAAMTGAGDPAVDVLVFSNQDDEEPAAAGHRSPDATFDGESLRLRAERCGDGAGRVYLIVVLATDAAGNVGFDCCSVVVPHDRSAAAFAEVAALAELAEDYCLMFGAAPPGFGPVGGG